MPIRRPVALRGRAVAAGAIGLLLCGACSADSLPTASAAPASALASDRPTPAPTPGPTPTPDPTPRFTNAADPELAALFPAAVNGIALVVPPVESFGLTPGDVGLAYGELGVRFETLAIAYADQPRLTVYAMRVDGPVTTDDLEPHLAAAGRYVGIAGLEREPWELTEAGGHRAWSRGGDNATAAGTVIYTWAAEEYVFLVIGVDDGMVRSVVAALPGEAPVLPSPSGGLPSASPSGG
jgi:hypothetical protein